MEVGIYRGSGEGVSPNRCYLIDVAMDELYGAEKVVSKPGYSSRERKGAKSHISFN